MPKKNIARGANNAAPGKPAVPESSQSTHEPVRRFTTVPIEQDSEWVRLPLPGQSLYGLRRTFLCELALRGKIKSVNLREVGKARGVRLLYKPSILAFIEEKAAAQNAKPPGGE